MPETRPQFVSQPDAQYGYRLTFWRDGLAQGEAMRDFGSQFSSKTVEQYERQPLDVVGIDFTGALLAGIGQIGRLADGLSGNLLTCHPSNEWLLLRRAHLSGEPSGAAAMLFDNSIRSGRTLERAVNVLERYDIYPDHVLKLIDYQDEREEHVNEVTGRLGMTALSMYTVDQVEIIDPSASASPEG